MQDNVVGLFKGDVPSVSVLNGPVWEFPIILVSLAVSIIYLEPPLPPNAVAQVLVYKAVSS